MKFIKVTDNISEINNKVKLGDVKWAFYSNGFHYYKIIKK